MKNQLNAIALAFDNVQSVSIKFDSYGKSYTYLSLHNVAVDDLVIVDSPSGYKVVTVVGVRNDLPLELLEADYEYKFIVQKVEVERNEMFKANLNVLRTHIANKQKLAKEAARQKALAKAKKQLGLDEDVALAEAVKILRATMTA